MDGGKFSWAKSKDSVLKTVQGAGELVASYDPDFALIEEVDLNSTRSYHVNEYTILKECLADYDTVFAQNYDSAFLFYPFTQPHGKSRSGLALFSRYPVTDSLRRRFPVSTSFSKFFDLDRCYSISRVPVDNGKEFVIFELHMSAYGNSDAIREGQIRMLDEKRAVMEMAAASGLPLVSDEKRDPRYTTSYGTGEMIRDALERGFRDISIAIGGSATNDGGIGCIRALGGRFLDENGEELKGCGGDLIKIKKIDISGLNPLIKECRFTVMCDVTNPLCGKDGATYTFGRQKGATPEIQDELEKGMCNYRDIIQKQFGMDMDNVKGAGAAGGLGSALMVFLNGTLKSGIETVLDLVDFDRRLEGVDVVVTGEGATDWQSVFGKVMQGVGIHCKAHGIPAVAIVGSMGKGAEDIFEYGIESMITTINGVMTLPEALDHAEELYLGAARRLFRMLRAGRKLSVAVNGVNSNDSHKRAE